MDLGSIPVVDWIRILVPDRIPIIWSYHGVETMSNEVKKWETKQEDLVYRIQDLNECFEWLQNVVVDYEDFAEMKEKRALAASHMGLGRWIRNNLGLWADCQKEPAEERAPLVRWFNKKGIYHPDDMSGIILTSWHRQLNGKKKKIKKQVKRYRTYWEKENPKVNGGKL